MHNQKLMRKVAMIMILIAFPICLYFGFDFFMSFLLTSSSSMKLGFLLRSISFMIEGTLAIVGILIGRKNLKLGSITCIFGGSMNLVMLLLFPFGTIIILFLIPITIICSGILGWVSVEKEITSRTK